MLNIVAVHVGNYCDRGKEYVERLFQGVREHLPIVHKRWCITDDPSRLPEGITPIPVDGGVNGWWNKIALFRPGLLPKGERALYFDLDTIITGDLSELAAYFGRFAMARDFYFPHHCSSAIMAWEAGACDHIWRVWDRCGRPEFQIGGDQEWIEAMMPAADRLQDVLPEQVVSYKVDCRATGFAPKGASIVAFHGKPRPHEIDFNIRRQI
jgi:hypothetical protein